MCLLRTLFLIVCVAISANASAMDILETNLKSHVIFLSEKIGERNYLDTEKLDKAADYIEEKFRSYKCNVKRQSFKAENKTYYNIEAEVKGTSDIDKMIVIGAHYDTIIGTPGADDNASGVAGILNLHALPEKPLPYKIRLVAFALEKSLHFSGQRIWGAMSMLENLKRKAQRWRGWYLLR